MKTSTLTQAPAEADGGGFLPDFCNVRMVFAVVIGAQLLAFILALVSHSRLADAWGQLSLISLFVQWVGLSCAFLLCLSRPLLTRLQPAAAGLVALSLILGVTAVVSEAAYHLFRERGPALMLSPHGHWPFLGRNLLVAAIVGGAALRYFYVQFQWRHNVQAQARARVQALQARIRPPFMFNSMNTIASLTRSDPAVAESVVEDLAELFRASLADAGQLTTLAQELELCRRYLHIEALRLGNRLQVHWAVDGLPPRTPVPALTIQPLLENAVYHGIEPRPEGGAIQVEGTWKDGVIRMEIKNPLGGEMTSAGRRSHHMALANVRERLALYFGGRASLKTREEGGHFLAILCLPAGEDRS